VLESTTAGSNRSPNLDVDTVERLFYYPATGRWPANIVLKTKYDGRYYARDIFLDDPIFAERLAQHLKKTIGQTISEVGEIDLEF
jgi:hypothetical protein